MQEYYVIYTTGEIYGETAPCYLTLVNGKETLLQGSLYDASKFTNLVTATKELVKAQKTFNDRTFEVIPVDKRIFGTTPRNLED